MASLQDLVRRGDDGVFAQYKWQETTAKGTTYTGIVFTSRKVTQCTLITGVV